MKERTQRVPPSLLPSSPRSAHNRYVMGFLLSFWWAAWATGTRPDGPRSNRCSSSYSPRCRWFWKNRMLMKMAPPWKKRLDRGQLIGWRGAQLIGNLSSWLMVEALRVINRGLRASGHLLYVIQFGDDMQEVSKVADRKMINCQLMLSEVSA